METYIIRRRSGWANEQALEEAAAVSARVGNEEMAGRVRWIRSYVVVEPDGTLGTVCVYQAADRDAIMEHAERASLPSDEIYPVTETVIVRGDPEDAL